MKPSSSPRGVRSAAPRPQGERCQWVRRHAQAGVHAGSAPTIDAPARRPARRARLPVEGAPGLGYNVDVPRRARQRRPPGRQGVRQPRPVQPDLLHGRQPREAPDRPARRGGHGDEGHRRRLRVPHRRRLRPLPLRHVRHRVPQGARATPASTASASCSFQKAGGIQQATGEDARPRDRPATSPGRSCARSSPATCSTSLGYRIRPYEVVPGATNAAIERVQGDRLRRGLPRTSAARSSRCCKCRRDAPQGRRSTARSPKPVVSLIGEFWAMTTEGDGNYHLQEFLEQRGRRGRHPGHHELAALHRLGERLRHRERLKLRGADQDDQARKGLAGKNATKKLLEPQGRVLGVRAIFQGYAKLHRPARLPPARHGARSPRLAKEHYSTTSAAARATWRSASSSTSWSTRSTT